MTVFDSTAVISSEHLLEYVQELSNRLTDSLDLESALKASLDYVLDTLDRESGAILVHSFSSPDPVLIVSRNLDRQWRVQLDDKASELREISRATQRRAANFQQDPALSLAAAYPLRVRDNAMGTLLLQGPPCREEELTILNHLGQVIARRILQDQFDWSERRPNQELAAILMTSALINKGMAPNELQARLMRSIYRFFQVEHGALILLDEDDHHLAIVKTLRNDAEWNYQVYLKNEPSLIGSCIERGETLVENQLQDHPSFNPDVDVIRNTTVHNMLCSPLMIDEEVQGALVLYNKHQGNFDAYDQRLITTISKMISYTIYDIDLVQRLRIASAELEVSRWQLLQSRNTLRALFDNIPLSMYIVDGRYSLVAINLSRANRADKKPSELVGKKCYQALYGRDDPCPSCQVDRTLFGGEDTNRSAKEYLDDHHSLDWEISTYPIVGDNGEVRQAILIEDEVTERKRLEDHLLQSEKLAVVGQLAAGVAHEINNPLTAIVANTQLLQQEFGEDGEAREALELIEFAGSRAAKVVGNLLNLARKDQYEFRSADVNSLIKESLYLLQHEIKAHGVKMIFQSGEDLPLLQMSKEQIKGVWTNLIINAIDAQKGQQTKEIRINTSADDEFVYVTIADRGPGIEPEKMKRIFEPFYTTKVAGEGTGLGLTICQRVIKQHGGHIAVDSEVGKGTQFTVQLPHSE